MALLIYCLLLTVLTMPTGAIEDHVLESDSCSLYDSCMMSEHYRSCSCDESCFKLGTCCLDAQGNTPMTQDKLEQWCEREGTVTPVFVKRTCASNFVKDERVVAACRSGSRTGPDLFENILVSSNATLNTYWNLNCAICNHEESRNLAYWKVQVVCPARYGDRNITRDLIHENLVYREQNKRWGLDLGGEFVNCSLRFSQPHTLWGRLKYCPPILVDSCPPDYHDEDFKKKCTAFYGERQHRNSPRYFKNVHCALCNGLRIEDLRCSVGLIYEPVIYDDTSETIRVSFESVHWNKIGIHMIRCGSKLEYDPFQDRCIVGRKSAWNFYNSASIKSFSIFSIVLSLLLICIRNKLT